MESTERFIMGGLGGGGEEAWVLYSAGLCRLSCPFVSRSSAVQQGGEEDAQGTSEPAPALLFPDHLVHFHPPGSDEEER